MVRSVLAIVAGFVFIAACAIGTSVALQAAVPTAFTEGGGTSSLPILLFSIAYVGVFAVAGCWLAARLAPSHPMRHALILGALGLAFNVFSAAGAWELFPAWYNVLQIALTMPWAWLGGRLRERQLESGARRAVAPA